MRVAFLVSELGRSGGMAVVREHASHLRAHEGMDCELVVCAARSHDLPAEVDDVPVRRLSEMAETQVDVAIATWWATTESLWDLPASHRVVLLQSEERRYYREGEHPDGLGAEAVFDLPAHWLAVSDDLRRLVVKVRPDARVWLVRPGIDKAVFRPGTGTHPPGPLRVLVEGQPSMWFKGIAEGIAAVRRMAEPAMVTVVASDPAQAGPLDADRVTGGLDPPAMAALYAEHDVLVKLSRFEGLGLPVLEAFHVGLPCVVTPFGGAAEFVEHGSNGFVVGFDDEPGTSAALDRLARDGELRARLRDGALATAARWPDRREASLTFAAAVRDIAASEPPAIDVALRRLAHGRRRAAEVQRAALRRDAVVLQGVRGEVTWWRDAQRQTHARLDECGAKVGEYGAWVTELESRIAALQARFGFRVEERLKRLLRRA